MIVKAAKKMGRPIKPPDEKLGYECRVAMRVDDGKALERLAQETGISMSAYVRMVLFAHLKTKVFNHPE